MGSRLYRIAQVGYGLGVVLIIGVGTFLAVVGLRDFLMATRSEDRVIGLTLAVAGFATLAALILLANGRRGWATAGLMSAGALGGLILLSIQTAYQADYRCWYWAAIAVTPLVGAAVTLLAGRRKPTLPHGSSSHSGKPEILAAVLAATATIIGAVIGLLGGAFRPVANPSILDVDVRVEEVGQRQGPTGETATLVHSTATVENIGKKRLVFFGSSYTVQGYMSTSRTSSTPGEWPVSDELSNNGWSGRYESPFELEAIEMGYDIVAPGDYLEPGQSVIWDWVTPVYNEHYNTIVTQVTAATAYADRLPLSEQFESSAADEIPADSVLQKTWRIEPTSWTGALTRGESTLTLNYDLSFNDTRGIDGSADSKRRSVNGMEVNFSMSGDAERQRSALQEPSAEFSERIHNFYGTGWTLGSADLALKEG